MNQPKSQGAVVVHETFPNINYMWFYRYLVNCYVLLSMCITLIKVNAQAKISGKQSWTSRKIFLFLL